MSQNAYSAQIDAVEAARHPQQQRGAILVNEHNAAPPKKGNLFCKFMPLIVALGLLAGLIVGGLYLFDKGPFGDGSSDVASAGNVEDRPSSCDSVSASDRMIMYWQSEVEGCDDIPDGVTHVVFGFAEVGDGDSTVKAEFQGNDNTLRACVKSLRERCIYTLGSVGGANNVPQMATINDPEVFAESVLNMIETFGFDGADIDDETVGDQYNEARITNYMKATHSKLKSGGNDYMLAFDGLVYAGLNDRCTDAANAEHSRCFPSGVTQYVDWVNILAYNVASTDDAAAEIYEGAIDEIFPEWISLLGSASKATLGVCVPGGCAYGPGPSNSVVADWTKFSSGGMMIYTGSAERGDGFPVSKIIINEQN